MGQLDFNYTLVHLDEKHTHDAVSPKEFERFNPDMLELGDISMEASSRSVLAVVVDLQGFTSFCNQDDPQLVIPEYLDSFLTWLFASIGKSTKKETKDGKVILWGRFPFFAKFMGDGVLFLWDTKGQGKLNIGNIVLNLREVANDHRSDFYPVAEKAHSKVPNILRVGVARGEVLSIGGGKDFVGPCINMASRLQKIGSLPFAFSRRGIDPKKFFIAEWHPQLVTIEVSVRGVKEKERVVVFESDYKALPDAEKKEHPIIERHA
jgi:class 3 adenylate cyclase